MQLCMNCYFTKTAPSCTSSPLLLSSATRINLLEVTLFVCQHVDALLLPMRIILCMAMLLHILVNLYCICDLYVKVSLIIFSGYFIQVHLVTYVTVLMLPRFKQCMWYEHMNMRMLVQVQAYTCQSLHTRCWCFMFPLNRSKVRSTLISLPAQCLCTCMHEFLVLFLHVCLLGL